jgi:crossover junction endodeoxyribonuclease RusA
MEWVQIPCPPSANALFKTLTNRRRAMTGVYHAWINEAGWLLKAANLQRFGNAPVMIEIQAKENRRRDLGNYEKPITDLLVSLQIINDDRNAIVRKIVMTWGKHTCVRVTPWREDDECVVSDAPDTGGGEGEAGNQPVASREMVWCL